MSLYEASEAVARGHPDKVADQISDAILDALLQVDPSSRVAVEALVSHTLVAIGGEITSEGHVNIEEIVRAVLAQVGYNDAAFGDFVNEAKIVTSITRQSPDIAQSIGTFSSLRAGDQGIMFGYACRDTPSFMPKSYEVARTIVAHIEQVRKNDKNSIFGPDGKTEVALKDGKAIIVVSWQHISTVDLSEVRTQLTQIVEGLCAQFSVIPKTILANPGGRFVLGGPFADTGLTGRKQMVDSYGTLVHHGGGSYSGKDATKVDRSGAYMARYLAKHVVAAGLADRCETQLVFSIGQETPLCLGLNCFGTEQIPEEEILALLNKNFPLTVSGIIRELSLTEPIFQQTAYGGHFGREQFSWERLSRLALLSP
jgi:S-adenosylmethionine synthetase